MEDPDAYRQSLRRKLQFSDSASHNLNSDDDIGLSELSNLYIDSER